MLVAMVLAWVGEGVMFWRFRQRPRRACAFWFLFLSLSLILLGHGILRGVPEALQALSLVGFLVSGWVFNRQMLHRLN